MEDKRLREGDISASSYYNSNLAPWFGRLNHLYAWMARTRNTKQWLKINFGYVTRFKGIASQGRSNADQWVTSYLVTFSRYGNSYVTYKENKRVKVSCCRKSSLEASTSPSRTRSCLVFRLNPLPYN